VFKEKRSSGSAGKINQHIKA